MTNLSGLFAVVVFGAVIALISGPAYGEEPETAQVKIQERALTLDQLPAPVKATVLKEAGDHELTEIEEITSGKAVIYEAEWIESGMEVAVQVAPDGKLLGKETEKPDGDEDADEDDDIEDDEGDD